MIKVAIVDDHAEYIDVLAKHLGQYQKDKHTDFSIRTFSSALEMISEYEPDYDILFLDIEMPYMNGLELAKSIRKSDPYAIIVFVTNMPQYAVKGYEVNAFDYMVKPIDYSAFEVKMDVIMQAVKKDREANIKIPWEDSVRNLSSDDVLYIEVRDHWLYFQTTDEEYQMLGSLKEMEDLLKDHHFVRCSKSYLINLQHVTRMKSDNVSIQGGYELKISRAKRKAVQFAFIDFYHNQNA